MYLYNEFIMNINNDINSLSCPSESNSNKIELTVHTSCYWGRRLTLCYSFENPGLETQLKTLTRKSNLHIDISPLETFS